MKFWQATLLCVFLLLVPLFSACGPSEAEKAQQRAYDEAIKAYQEATQKYQEEMEAYRKQLEEAYKEYEKQLKAWYEAQQK